MVGQTVRPRRRTASESNPRRSTRTRADSGSSVRICATGPDRRRTAPDARSSVDLSAAKARSKGLPYDDASVKRCTILAAALRSTGLPETAREPLSAESRIAASFIEAYFSNYIEGTRFVVEEAKKIVFDGVMPAQRPQDGHDVLATYRQLVNLGTRAPSTISIKDFEEEIKARHADLMSGRPENAPGQIQTAAECGGKYSVRLTGSSQRGRCTPGSQSSTALNIHSAGQCSCIFFSRRPSVRRRQWAHQSNHDDQRTVGVWIVADHDPDSMARGLPRRFAGSESIR